MFFPNINLDSNQIVHANQLFETVHGIYRFSDVNPALETRKVFLEVNYY